MGHVFSRRKPKLRVRDAAATVRKICSASRDIPSSKWGRDGLAGLNGFAIFLDRYATCAAFRFEVAV
jgi:hypothetical protein